MSNLRWKFQRWITPAWYHYIFERQYVGKRRPTLRMIFCRMREHPYPVVWYNVNALEPDMTCTNCGEDLG